MPLLRHAAAFLLISLMLPGAGAQSLPAGGRLDGARVIEQRYGTARPDDTPAPSSVARAGAPRADPAPPAVTPPSTGRPARIPDALATLVVDHTGGKEAALVPLTFGQVFKPGALGRGEQLGAVLADGTPVQLQADIKASHPDGSLRHVVLSALVPSPRPGKPLALGLVKARRPDLAKTGKGQDSSLDALLRGGADATLQVTLDGKAYTANLARLLVNARPELWLDGPIAREWQVTGPLAGPDGQAHPHLAARFAVRWYPALDQARIDLTVENNWAFEPAPRNFLYDVRVTVGGTEAFSAKALTHYHHARWRKLFWLGGAPSVHLRHDTKQLIESLALPNYDQSVVIDEKALSRMHAQWNGPRTEPMGAGLANPRMHTTGGRPDIGLLPGWAAMYLLGMDRRAAEMTLGTADLAGSWPIHYRDRRTGLPVSLADPPMPGRGKPADVRKPATGRSEPFPRCAAPEACDNPYAPDLAHQPALSYLPYLLTGDHYHLEELQFWAMRNASANRENHKGLLKDSQVRGQAWGLRTLGQAAYITPDRHPLKRDLAEILDANLDWYNATFTHNRNANALGVLIGPRLSYNNKRGMAPWQDDFFTSAVGHLAELGFGKARELLVWKAKFPVSRMTGEGVCWIHGAMYSMNLRDHATAPFYTTIGDAYRATIAADIAALPCAGADMAAALKRRVGEMTGSSSSVVGYPSTMQPALAYAADALGEPGRKAWRQFMARSVKPNYGAGPQFAIVPR